MITYTEKEIKEYFKIMKNRFGKNSGTYEHLRSIEYLMFHEDPYSENIDTLKKVLKKD